MVRTVRPSEDDRPEPIGDYVVDREAIPGTPIGTQLVRILRAVLLIVLAAVSLGLFWVVGLWLGIF